MAKRKRIPGDTRPAPNFSGGMTQQIQTLQQKMMNTQAALEEQIFEVSAGGGAIIIEITGQQKINKITISPEVIDPNDVEMLQDLIVAAVNEAIEKSKEVASQQFEGLTNGIHIPGLF